MAGQPSFDRPALRAGQQASATPALFTGLPRTIAGNASLSETPHSFFSVRHCLGVSR
jgi:hypothetical protein